MVCFISSRGVYTPISMFIEQKGALRNKRAANKLPRKYFRTVFALVYLICVCEFTPNSFYVDTFSIDCGGF